MKKYQKMTLAILVGLTLSACGSGGGSAQSGSSTATDNKTGGVFIFSGENENLKLTKAVLQNSNLSSISVDGITIPLGQAHSAEWTIIKEGAGDDEKELHFCCGKYENVRFGIYNPDMDDSDVNSKFYYFYNGSPTTNMPTAGVVNYTGHSIFESADVDGTVYGDSYEDFLKGTAQFTADFNTKTLTGTLNLNEGNVAPVKVISKISGNNFSGTATTATFNSTAEVEGKFYGDNAKELGGVYDDGKRWGGAFGASQ